MQRRTGRHILISLCLIYVPHTLVACSDRGDLGRHDPSFAKQTYTGTLAKVRKFAGGDEAYDLPLTAAEDALRNRYADLQSMQYAGVVAQIDRARNMDGFAHAEALLLDLKVERERFSLFARTGGKVMQIDDARHNRLKGLDSLTARRQMAAVRRRYRENNLLIRNGLRHMRARTKAYKEHLKKLPIEWPQVPLEELEMAHENFHEDVVQFHGKIDEHDFRLLGENGKISYK